MFGTVRPWWAVIALSLCSFPALAQAPATPAPAAPEPGVAARVNGQPITEIAVQRGLERIDAAKRAQARPELIDYLVDNLLIEQYLQQLRVTVDKAEVDKKIDEIRQAMKRDGKDFAKMLQDLKLTENELRDHIAADLRWEKFVTSQATDKALRELFDKNKELFDGTAVHARHILLAPATNDAKSAEAAVAQLRGFKKDIEAKVAAGLAKLPANSDNLAREKARTALLDEAFAAVAKEKSACPSKDQGGDIGWFRRAGPMVEPFSQAAFSLKPYEMSDAVKTQFGYHLILVTERKPGRDIKFEEAKDYVKEQFGDQLRRAVAAQVRQKSKIEVYPAPRVTR